MALTPLDIHQKEFKRGFRGYDEDEVDTFLDEIIRDYEATLKERDHYKDQVAELNRRVEQYHQLEQNLQRALVVAQSTAEEVKAAAHREAELIIREAEQRASEATEQAKHRVVDVERRAEELRQELQIFKAKVRSMMQTQLELLDAPLDDRRPRVVPPPTQEQLQGS